MENADQELGRIAAAARDARPSITSLARAADRAGDAFGSLIRGAPKSLSEFTDGVGRLLGTGGHVTKAMKFAEGYIGVWQGLTQYGVNFGNQLDEMIIQTGQANMRMEQLSRIVQNSSRDLAGLGVTANQGIQGFLSRQARFYESQVADYDSVQRRLLALGLTTEGINERFLQFDLMNNIRNRVEITTAAQRTQQAGKFAEEMDRLAKLTGKQADQIAKEQMDLQRQGNIYAAQMELPAATQGQLVTTISRMNDFGKTIGNVSTDILTRGFIDPNDPAALAVQSFGEKMMTALYRAREAMQRGDAEEARRQEAIAAEEAAALRTNRDFLRMASLGGATDFSAGVRDVVTDLNTSGQALSQSAIRNRVLAEGQVATAENMAKMRDRIIAEQQTAQITPGTGNTIINGYNELLVQLQGVARAAQEPTVRAFTNIGNAAMEEVRNSLRGANLGNVVNNAISEVFGAFGMLNRGQDFAASIQDLQAQYTQAARLADQQGNREEALRLQAKAEEAARIRAELGRGAIDENTARSRLTALGNAFTNTGPLTITATGRTTFVTGNVGAVTGNTTGGNTTQTPGSGGEGPNNIGTFGRTGSFFANFGSGTSVRLHGIEGVFRPNHIEDIMSKSANGTIKELIRQLTETGFGRDSTTDASNTIRVASRSIDGRMNGMLNTVRNTLNRVPSVDNTEPSDNMRQAITEALSTMPANMKRAFEEALGSTLTQPINQLVAVSSRGADYQEQVYKNTRGMSQDYLRGA